MSLGYGWASATRPEMPAVGGLTVPWADEVVLAPEEPGPGTIAVTAKHSRRRRADAAGAGPDLAIAASP
jgi:hypothetical protein